MQRAFLAAVERQQVRIQLSLELVPLLALLELFLERGRPGGDDPEQILPGLSFLRRRQVAQFVLIVLFQLRQELRRHEFIPDFPDQAAGIRIEHLARLHDRRQLSTHISIHRMNAEEPESAEALRGTPASAWFLEARAQLAQSSSSFRHPSAVSSH